MRSQTIRRVSVIAIALVAVGCGSAGQATSGPSVSPTGLATASAPSSPAPSKAVATASAAPSSPTPIVTASIAPEAALVPLWDAKGPIKTRGWTWEPAVDPSGRIWAPASFDNVFWIFDKDGTYLESWGMPGNQPGQFKLWDGDSGFGAIAFRSDGGFYVADSGNHRVQRFDKDRAFVRTWGSFGTDDGQFALPIDIATDGADHVYVFSDSRHDIQKFSPEGVFEGIVATGVGPYMTVAKDGTVYAISDDPTPQVRIFGPDGTWQSTLDLRDVVSFATGIAVTEAGRIFVGSSTDGGANPVYQDLIELDTAGHVLHRWPTGVEGVAVNAAGDRLYAVFSQVTPVVRAYAVPTD